MVRGLQAFGRLTETDGPWHSLQVPSSKTACTVHLCTDLLIPVHKHKATDQAEQLVSSRARKVVEKGLLCWKCETYSLECTGKFPLCKSHIQCKKLVWFAQGCMCKGMGPQSSLYLDCLALEITLFCPSILYPWLRSQWWGWRKASLWQGITIFSVCISLVMLREKQETRFSRGELNREIYRLQCFSLSCIQSLWLKYIRICCHPELGEGKRLTAVSDSGFSLIKSLDSGPRLVKLSFPTMGFLLLFRCREIVSFWFKPVSYWKVKSCFPDKTKNQEIVTLATITTRRCVSSSSSETTP